MAQKAAGRRSEREPVRKSVVDVQIEVKASARHLIQLTGLEVPHLDQLLQCAEAVDARRLGPLHGVEDQRDATNVHAPAPYPEARARYRGNMHSEASTFQTGEPAEITEHTEKQYEYT